MSEQLQAMVVARSDAIAGRLDSIVGKIDTLEEKFDVEMAKIPVDMKRRGEELHNMLVRFFGGRGFCFFGREGGKAAPTYPIETHLLGVGGWLAVMYI